MSAYGSFEESEKKVETYPFPICVLLLLMRFVQILGVETNDSDGKDELEQAKSGIEDEENEASASLTISEGHVERLIWYEMR